MGLEPLFLLQKQVLAYMLHLSAFLFLLEPSEQQNKINGHKLDSLFDSGLLFFRYP